MNEETPNEFSPIQHIKERSDLAESLKELNDDTKDAVDGMSGIDLRTRLHFTEIAPILASDTLVSFNFLPKKCIDFTRQKKRLAVSVGGKGRDEIVKITGGYQEEQSGKSLFNKIGGAFGNGGGNK